MEELLRDLSGATRRLLREWGTSLTVIASIAIAVSANATVFGWVQAIVANPLPAVPDSNRLVVFASKTQSAEFTAISYADYLSYREAVGSLSGLTVFQERALSLESEGHAERVWAMFVAGNFFDVLRLNPVIGSFYKPDQLVDTVNGQAVAVLSYDFWRSRFNFDPGAVGKRIVLNGQAFTIVGVAPKGFKGTISGLSYDIWLPALQQDKLTGGDGKWITDRRFRALHAMARLADGKSASQAQSELDIVAARLATTYPEDDTGMGAAIMSLAHAPYGAQSLLADILKLLLLASFVVLIVVCSNLSNLLLLSASRRDKEIGVRMALGAKAGRIARQMTTEAALTAGIAAGAGLVLTDFWLGLLRLFVPDLELPVALQPELSPGVVGYCLAMTFLVVALASAMSIVRATGIDVCRVVREGSRGSSAGRPQQRLRMILVALQVAFAFVTLVGAVLLVIGFSQITRIDPGFDARKVWLFALAPAGPGTSAADMDGFVDRARERLLSKASTRGVAYADYVPLGLKGGSWEDLQVEGYTPRPDESMKIHRSLVSADYFSVMRIPVVDGREFTARDTRESGAVAVINQTFAARYFAGRNPVGRRIAGWGRVLTVVGVVKDSKYETPTETPRPYFYVPYRQFAARDTDIVIHVAMTGDSPALANDARRELSDLGSAAYVSWSMPMQTYIASAVFKNKLAMTLLCGLAIAALVLAAMGIYGVLSSYVAQRTAEIGIRMALGSSSGRIVQLILVQGLRPVAIGLGAGVVISLAASRIVSGLFYGTWSLEASVYAEVAVLLAAIATLVCVVPAYRAGRLDPAAALRIG